MRGSIYAIHITINFPMNSDMLESFARQVTRQIPLLLVSVSIQDKTPAGYQNHAFNCR
jgi:hypothetical protein